MTAPLLMLAPPARTLEWQDRSLCSQVDPELFYVENEADEAEAKKVCAGCPVRAECLDYALSVGDLHGVWGGMTDLERRAQLFGEKKPCTKCGVPKAITEFHRDFGSRYGVRAQCKDCSKGDQAVRRGHEIVEVAA